jgi:hypothetical protein
MFMNGYACFLILKPQDEVGHPMSLCPFGLYCSACFGVNPEKTNHNSGGSVGKSYSHVHKG